MQGLKFGSWTVLSPADDNVGARQRWNCQCACGSIYPVLLGALRAGKTTQCRSCGNASKNYRSRMSEYRIWTSMGNRCNNPNDPSYHRYGGRGIKRLYSSFDEFIADIGLRPLPHPIDGKYTVDRWPDPDGHYEPGNCRWATAKQQRNNQSRATQ